VTAPEPLEVNQVIDTVQRHIRRTLREDIELHCALAQDLGAVKIDRGQLEQLVMNLAVNARDAMPEGGTLAIATRNTLLGEDEARGLRLAPGRYVEIEIADTGVGIPADIIDHIYEPFFTTKADGHGTGLGLATAYSIAQQARAALQVTTELHDGTTFRVYLPITDEPPSERLESLGGELRGRGETVLVVEDDVGVRTLVRRLLQAAGYEVLAARQGQEGLDMFRQHTETIDLVLTDVVMPKLRGNQLAEEIRALRPGIRIAFMSGYAGGTVIRSGLQDRATSFLAKPFTKRQLLELVRDALKS
jgi:CheY-like chemotaxis protein